MDAPISLCMIVRNEARNLRPCLEGLAGLFDEIIIVDTGSTDGTKAVAAELGAKVFDFPWSDDFSAARNQSLRHASGQWIFWLDADDRIDAANREKLAALFARIRQQPRQDAVYVMTCESRVGSADGPAINVSHLRLFPNHPALAWRGRIHEYLDLDDAELATSVQWSDVVIQHVGHEDPVHHHQKRYRDLRLLQIEYATNPNNAATLFFLGWTQLGLGRQEEGLRLLKRSVQRESNPRQPHLRKAYALISRCLDESNRRAEAAGVCDAGLALFPDDPELLFQKAVLLSKGGDAAGAEACYLRLLGTPPRDYLQCGVEQTLRGPKARYKLGLLYKDAGHLPAAEMQFRAALAQRPTYSEAWASLGQLYLQAGRWQDAAAVVQRLEGCPLGEILAPTLRAQLLSVQGNVRQAIALLEQVVRRNGDVRWPLLVLAELLLATQSDWKRCIEVHEELLAQNPNDAAARLRLSQLWKQHGEPATAGEQSSENEHRGSSADTGLVAAPGR